MLLFIKKLFASPTVVDIPQQQRKHARVQAREKALDLYYAKQYEVSLPYFDEAIALGSIDILAEREYVFHQLDSHLSAIDDFSEALSYFPTNANNYFGRAHSRHLIGDFEDAIIDIKKAVSFSREETEENKQANLQAIKIGWHSATYFYQSTFDEILSDASADERLKQLCLHPARRRPEK